jgi:NADPH2:quinone reductase
VATRWLAVDFGGPEVLKKATIELPPPGAGAVTIEVRAAGMNPADFKHFGAGQDPDLLPLSVGYEVAGVVTDLGRDAHLASGGGAIGDEVVAYQVMGGYASAITVDANDVFAKPNNLSFAEAANLLLVGATAAEMLHVTSVARGDTVLLHGAAGAVGTSVLQQARVFGARVIGTANEVSFDSVRRSGGIPVQYGPGLEDRVREAAPDGITAALDTVGTDEAVEVSLALVHEHERTVSIAAFSRGERDNLQLIGRIPSSTLFRASVRPRILGMAAKGQIELPIAQIYPMSEVPAAVRALMGSHAYGQLALVP